MIVIGETPFKLIMYALTGIIVGVIAEDMWKRSKGAR